MEKHRGFPGRLAGTDFQFTLRRENKAGATALVARKRFADRKNADRKADEAFLYALIEHFGDAPFVRGNLDAGRISWFWGREIIAGEDPFDPACYDALLQINMKTAFSNFPHLFAEGWTP